MNTASTTINLAEAAKLVMLVDRAAAGEEIIVAKAGRPSALRRCPIEPRRPDIAAHWEDDEALLAPTDPEDLDWANGKYTDEFGISLPRKS